MVNKDVFSRIFTLRLVRISALGLVLVVTSFAGLYLGVYLDHITHMSPNFTLVGLILGIILGFKGFIEETLREKKEGKSF